MLRLPVLPASPMLDLHMTCTLFLFVLFNHDVTLTSFLAATTRHNDSLVADHNIITAALFSGQHLQHADGHEGNDQCQVFEKHLDEILWILLDSRSCRRMCHEGASGRLVVKTNVGRFNEDQKSKTQKSKSSEVAHFKQKFCRLKRSGS